MSAKSGCAKLVRSFAPCDVERRVERVLPRRRSRRLSRGRRGESAPAARRTSPCRSPPGRRSTRRAAGGLRGWRRARRARRSSWPIRRVARRGCGAPGKASLSGGASIVLAFTAGSSETRGQVGAEPLFHHGPDRLADEPWAQGRVDHGATLRLVARDAQKGLAERLVERLALPLITVGGLGAAPRAGALAAQRDGKVENERQVRTGSRRRRRAPARR